MGRLPTEPAFAFADDLADRTGPMAKSRSLSWRLGMLTLFVVLPLVVFALIMVGWIAYSDREATRKALIGDAFALADDVTRQINTLFLLSAALSRSNFLQQSDLSGFAEQAPMSWPNARAHADRIERGRTSRIERASLVREKSPLLRDRAALVSRAIGAGAAFFSDVSAEPEAHASIEAPVFAYGKPIYEVSLIVPPEQFDRLLQAQNLPGSWLSAIVDRRGAFVARRRPSPGRPGLRQPGVSRCDAAPAKSTVTHKSISGQKIVSAYAAAAGGWTVGVAAGARTNSDSDPARFSSRQFWPPWRSPAASSCPI